MKYLLPLFFIPLSFAGSPPGCEELGKILQGYEKDLNGKAIKDCSKLKADDLIGTRPVVNKEYLKDKLCLESGAIETQLERLKAELAILDGIDKLKATLKVTREDSSTSTEAGKSFVASLNTAQSLELLLNTQNTKNENLAQYLKKEVTAKENLKGKINEFCKDLDKKTVNACNPDAFKPEDKTIADIFELINKPKEVNNDQITAWKNQLAIKRIDKKSTEAPYSFHIMQTELSEAFQAIDSKGIMTKAHLKAISRLDEFENNPTGLAFVDDINSIKDKKKTKFLSDKLFLLMGDAKARQQYEMQSKLSVLFDNYKDTVGEICPSVKINFESAKKCFDDLKTNKSKVSSAGFHSQLESIEASMNFIKVLSDQEATCKEKLKQTELLPEECYRSMTKDKADVKDQILQLNVLKDKIGSENMDLMTYRNLALNKWYKNSNCGKVETPMDLCEVTDTAETISKSALMTVSNSMNVAIMFTPKPEEEVNKKAEELCNDENKKKTKAEERLCEFFDDTTPDILTKKEDNSDGPVNAPDGRHEEANIRDAWLQGGAGLLAQGLSYFMNKNTPPIQNPYPYNYAPYSGGGGMGIADSIMFNARYQGAYGFYMPTPGYAPGNAFPSSSMTSYRPLSGSGGRFFGNKLT